jgi:hypothetical protein
MPYHGRRLYNMIIGNNEEADKYKTKYQIRKMTAST